MKWKNVAMLVVAIVLIGGCQGAPLLGGVQSKANNELNLGFGRKLTLGAETDVTMEGFKTRGGSEIKKITLKQSPGQTMREGWVPVQDSYGGLMERFPGVLDAYGRNTVNIMDAGNRLLQTAMPAVMSHVEGRTTVALAKQQTAQMKNEILGAFAGGLLNPSGVMDLLTKVPGDVTSELITDPVFQAALAKERTYIEAFKPVPAAPPPTKEPPHEEVGLTPTSGGKKAHICLANAPMRL